MAHMRRDEFAQNLVTPPKHNESKSFKKPHRLRRQVQPIVMQLWSSLVKRYFSFKVSSKRAWGKRSIL